MIKRQFAQTLYRKNQSNVEENQAPEEGAEEKKGNDWENNAVDKTRKKQLKILNKISNQGETKAETSKDEVAMVDYFFAKLGYYGSNEHTFETETKLDLF